MKQLRWHGMGYRSICGGEMVRLGRATRHAQVGAVGVAVERWQGDSSDISVAVGNGVIITVLVNGNRLAIPEAFLEVEDTAKVFSFV
jgi:hypothetical protein